MSEVQPEIRPINNERISKIRSLFDQVQATYEYPRPLTEICEQIGFPHTTLGKWLRNEAVPRRKTFEYAETALRELLADRQLLRTYEAKATLSAAGGSVRRSQSPLNSRLYCFLLGVAAGGALGATVMFLFY